MNQQELIQLHTKLNPENHFFSKESMRFWKTQVSTILQPASDGSVLFLTSDRDMNDTQRLYTLRLLKNEPNGGIETLSFQKHTSRAEAVKKLKEHKTQYEHALMA